MSASPLQTSQPGSNRLPVLATTINEHLEAAEAATRRGLEHAIAAGALLIEAKELVAHGEWLDWLQANCRVSERSAQVYMRLARNRHKLDALKNESIADLTIPGAVALVGKPKPERPHDLPGQLDLLGGPEVPPLTPPTGLERADLRAAFQERCAQAESFATYSGPVDDEVADAAERVVAAWERLARHLRGKAQDAKVFEDSAFGPDRTPNPAHRKIDYRLNPLRKGRSAFRNGVPVTGNPYKPRLHREWWERGWREAADETLRLGRPMTWKQRLALGPG